MLNIVIASTERETDSIQHRSDKIPVFTNIETFTTGSFTDKLHIYLKSDYVRDNNARY
jgi:hypothetical protein